MAVAIRLVVAEGLLVSLFLGAAGRWDLPWFWAVMAAHATALAVIGWAMDPDLRKERVRPGPGARDRCLRPVVIPFLLAHMVVAGLDVGRFHWSGEIPFAVHAVALAGYVAGMVLSVWAMTVNRFFSPVVRIQTDRGHRVVSTGPYRFLRHPGYTGLIGGAVCGGIAMGSWWSLVPLVPFIALFLWRTGMEDRVLRNELDGYADYAGRVRYRMVPGIW